MANAFDAVFETQQTATSESQVPVQEPQVTKDVNAFDAVFGGIEAPEVQPEQPLTQKLGERVTTGVPGRNVAEFAARTAVSPFGAQVRAGGQLIGGIGDIIAAGAKKTFKVLPEKGQQFIKDTASGIGDLMSASSESLTPEGLATKGAIQALQSSTEAYQEVKAKDPELAADLESLINLATVAPAGKVGREVFDTVGDVTNFFAKNNVKKINSKITKEVNEGILKGVKPSSIGKGTFKQREKFATKAQSAVENIIAEKDKLNLTDDLGNIVNRIPENLDEFSQSISQSKQSIFGSINKRLQLAGQEGVTGDVKPLLDSLTNMKNNGTFKRLAPSSLRNKIDDLIEQYEPFRDSGLDVAGMQDDIAFINKGTESFWKNPTFESAQTASIDEAVARELRKSLDNSVNSITDGSFQELKDAYGSLSSIEKDVANAFLREAKGRGGGLISEFGNVFSSTAALQGILTARPSLTVAAALGKIAVDVNKLTKSSDRLVKNMFKNVDELITERSNLGYNPRSKLGKSMQSRITNAQKAEIAEQQRLSVEGLSGGVTQPRPTVQPQRQLPAGQGFQLQGKPFTPFPVKTQTQIGFEGQIPKQLTGRPPIQKTKFAGKGQVVKSKPVLTGVPFIDTKIDIALSTPPFLRTAEQKLVIDLIVGGK